MLTSTSAVAQTRKYSNSHLVEVVPCDELKPPARKVRRALKHQSKHIQAGLKKFGLNLPILVDEENNIICGEAFFDAAVVLGHPTISVIRVTHLSKLNIRKYRMFFEKLPDLSEWDEEALHLEIQEIAFLDPDIGLDLPGFEPVEVDFILSDADSEQKVDEDDNIDGMSATRPPICRSGDLWNLDDHRLAVGDSLAPQTFELLMDSRTAQMVITDPPFNLLIASLVSTAHREFANASGEMSEVEFQEFLTTFLERVSARCFDGSLIHVFMDWRHQSELLAAAKAANLTQINLCVWVKTNAGMGSLYRSQHELVYIGKKGTAPHLNNIQLGKYGRNRTNVWSYAGMNTFHKDRDELLAAHPTVKPVAMIADAICDSTNRGDIVLDPFAGSGTIFLAAERTDRRAYGIEIDPEYCELAIDRWERKTGKKAIHSKTGLTRTELATVRRPVRKRKLPTSLKEIA